MSGKKVDAKSFSSWLDAYGHAWMTRDPESAAALYSESATYQVTPFVDPIRGRAAMRDYWQGVTQTEEDIRFEYEILAVTSDYGIARWWASFLRVPPGLPTNLDGIFLISLNPEGICESLREWWVKQQ